jgi:hypothetical protein
MRRFVVGGHGFTSHEKCAGIAVKIGDPGGERRSLELPARPRAEERPQSVMGCGVVEGAKPYNIERFGVIEMMGVGFRGAAPSTVVI